jgi:hypothetical protein
MWLRTLKMCEKHVSTACVISDAGIGAAAERHGGFVRCTSGLKSAGLMADGREGLSGGVAAIIDHYTS